MCAYASLRLTGISFAYFAVLYSINMAHDSFLFGKMGNCFLARIIADSGRH